MVYGFGFRWGVSITSMAFGGSFLPSSQMMVEGVQTCDYGSGMNSTFVAELRVALAMGSNWVTVKTGEPCLVSCARPSLFSAFLLTVFPFQPTRYLEFGHSFVRAYTRSLSL